MRSPKRRLIERVCFFNGEMAMSNLFYRSANRVRIDRGSVWRWQALAKANNGDNKLWYSIDFSAGKLFFEKNRKIQAVA